MNIMEIFRISGRNLKTRKKQTALTALGIMIGIAAIVSLLSLGEGFQVSITSQFEESFSTSTLTVTTGGGFMFGPPQEESDFVLYLNHSTYFENIDHVEYVVPILQQRVSIEGLEGIYTVYGVDLENYSQLFDSFTPQNGTIPTDVNSTNSVVGYTFYDPWGNGTIVFQETDDLTFTWTYINGSVPQVENYTSNISGILEETGTGFSLGGPSDTGIYIPIDLATEIFHTEEVNSFLIKLDSDVESVITQAIADINAVFPDELTVISPDQILDSISTIFTFVNIFLGGVAGISLIVAGVNILTVMTISLAQRKREIGIMKSLGMKDRSLLSIFLIEAILTGLIGAIAGIGVGWGLSQIFGGFLGGMGGGFGGMGGGMGGGQNPFASGLTITPVITPFLIILSLLFGVIVATIFGIVPAYRASRQTPVEALRYE